MAWMYCHKRQRCFSVLISCFVASHFHSCSGWGLPPPTAKVMFSRRLFVCLFVCLLARIAGKLLDRLSRNLAGICGTWNMEEHDCISVVNYGRRSVRFSYGCWQGCLSPLTPWSKFPFPLPSLTFRSLPLQVGPIIAARGSGERFSSPSGSGQSPAAKRYLVNFRLKILPLVAAIFRNLGGSALIINALSPKFLQKRFPLLFPWCICSIVYME